jgi:hypothetical protein
VTDGLPSPIFTREARPAYGLFPLQLTEIDVPFVRHTAGEVTDARKISPKAQAAW